MVLLIASVVSFIPFIALFLWLKNHVKEEAAYKKLCSRTLVQGFLCTIPVFLASTVFHIILRLTGLQEASAFWYEALHNFIVLAFAEELVKFLTFRRVLKKVDFRYSWVDVTVLMTIVGIGFGLLESVVYAVGASVPVVLIRGICLPHAGYGFLVGYFYGKGVKTGRSYLKWVGFLLAWFMHGLYDFSLSEEFVALNDNLVVIPLALAVVDIVLVFRLIHFIRKAKKEPDKYMEPIV